MTVSLFLPFLVLVVLAHLSNGMRSMLNTCLGPILHMTFNNCPLYRSLSRTIQYELQSHCNGLSCNDILFAGSACKNGAKTFSSRNVRSGFQYSSRYMGRLEPRKMPRSKLVLLSLLFPR